MPREYLFLLAGLAMGFLLGWLAGRRLPPQVEAVAEPSAPAVAAPAEEAAIKLVVNGNSVEIPPAAMAEIQGLIRSGDKAGAVKALGAATGMNQAAAKSVVASLEKVLV